MDMYKNSFAVAIKHNGKILRETSDLVHLPFGSEFTVLIKNLNSRRAKFTLHIDGTDVLGGQEIIVNANSDTEIKRFITNGNMNEGNAFKFIERTQKIEAGPRGIKIDDGMVRVEFWFEREVPPVITTTHYHRNVWYDDYLSKRNIFDRHTIGGATYGDFYNSTSGAGPDLSVKLKGATVRSMSASINNAVAQNASASVENEVGITVPGSKIEQTFTPVYGFNSETHSSVIVVRLAGTKGNVQVAAPVTVKTKQKCVTCHHLNKHNAKFCSECGTSLEIL